MTIAEFLKELSFYATSEKWGFGYSFVEDLRGFVSSAVRTRQDEERYCPITFLALKKANVNLKSFQYPRAAQHLGLDGFDAFLIARAADYKDVSDNYLRIKILQAVRLEDKDD